MQYTAAPNELEELKSQYPDFSDGILQMICKERKREVGMRCLMKFAEDYSNNIPNLVQSLFAYTGHDKEYRLVRIGKKKVEYTESEKQSVADYYIANNKSLIGVREKTGVHHQTAKVIIKNHLDLGQP